ncbi:hypothetical protein [Rhizobium lentis]|uniref:hypothetical protein n=1 Tax=Rhizobium lentis TaxID=1138194 RepID=UPI001C8326A1|nr:hypothetical protein [Rhizobium lentis]MBX4958932.1 hypothetical protein [Rhizobium lentis]MBX4988938.1 hypothetical protein [Rhizobium lentis]MBX5007387.1 hypothetical protein [Rhizobium lentis]MBX5031984.1 hypothetical protein [Rhizobium lentis]MBX5038076.1 hypothetical protein [Rhizobium lentis]
MAVSPFGYFGKSEKADQAPPAVIRLTKSAVERTGHARKKPSRQAIMILQHENMRANATELGFHDAGYSDF